MTPGKSLGGSAVEESLVAAGFAIPPSEVALVETKRPRLRPFGVVLAQNAWNVIPDVLWGSLIAPYPRSVATRIHARRILAQRNLRRAGRVVCLSETMAQWCRAAGITHVEMCPVSVPMSHLQGSNSPSSASAAQAPFVLVPGTITWYKRPHLALQLAADLGIENVVLAGVADQSGCLSSVTNEARRLGLSLRHEVLPDEQLVMSYRAAQAVVVPSALESLSFALAEALLHAEHVVASAIPAHQELGDRLGRTPTWIGGRDPATSSSRGSRRHVEQEGLRTEWVSLGASLGLSRVGEVS